MNLTGISAVLCLLVCANALPEDELETFIKLTKYGYEDLCSEAGESEWAFLNGPSNKTRRSWENAIYEYALYKVKQVNETSAQRAEAIHNASLEYAYNLVIKPGDALLQPDDLRKEISFEGEAKSARLTGFYKTGTKKHLRQDVARQLARTGRPEDKLTAWSEWHRTLSSQTSNFSRSLGLVVKAAAANGKASVTEYWEMLTGYEDGYRHAKDEWNKMSDLHSIFEKFVRSRLSKKYGLHGENDTLLAHLLGTLQGDDWTNIAMDVVPFSGITYNVIKNMWEKELVGESLYREASKMGQVILKHVPQRDFWTESQFRGQCPSHLVNLCLDGKMRIHTCSEASIGYFIEAHKNVARILVNQISHDSDPVLDTANRYSALEEGVAELFGVLSVSEAWLSSQGLIDNSTDAEEIRTASLTITALNVLPRLAYYLAADSWRLDAIENKTLDPDHLTSTWWQYRLNYEAISSSEPNLPTFLDDDRITSNRPYLSKFLGTLLGFQIYQYLMDSTEVRYETILPGSTQTLHQLPKMIHHGFGNDWTAVISKYLEIHEISADSLLSYFSSLEDYLRENEETLQDLAIPVRLEKELNVLEDTYRKKLREPVTTTTTVRTTSTRGRVRPAGSKQVLPSSQAIQKNSSTPSNSTSWRNAEVPPAEDVRKVVPETKSSEPEAGGDQSSDKEKTSASKAVWAVAAVLIATVTICVIAIFGRRRCRKAPKNRRYV